MPGYSFYHLTIKFAGQVYGIFNLIGPYSYSRAIIDLVKVQVAIHVHVIQVRQVQYLASTLNKYFTRTQVHLYTS